MSSPPPTSTQSWRSPVLWLTCGVLLSCLISLVVSLGVLTTVLGRDRVLTALRSGSLPQAATPPPAVTVVVVVPTEPPVSPTPAPRPATPTALLATVAPPAPTAVSSSPTGPAATATRFIANPAAATATALAGISPSAAQPAATPTPLATPASASVTREFTEAQLAQAFIDYLKGQGITPGELTVKLSDKKMRVSAQSLEAGMFGMGGFDMTGTFVAQNGKLQFVLQESPPDFPFTDFIVPRVSEIMNGLVSDLYVTNADIQEGKLIVTGTKR
jgi:hypothetical protein